MATRSSRFVNTLWSLKRTVERLSFSMTGRSGSCATCLNATQPTTQILNLQADYATVKSLLVLADKMASRPLPRHSHFTDCSCTNWDQLLSDLLQVLIRRESSMSESFTASKPTRGWPSGSVRLRSTEASTLQTVLELITSRLQEVEQCRESQCLSVLSTNSTSSRTNYIPASR